MSDRKIPCEFKFEAEDEIFTPEGSFASGDEAADKELVASIIKRLDAGDLAAWFCAKVTCYGTGEAEGFSGFAILGGCSYFSFDEFKKDPYYEDLCNEAYADMLREIRAKATEGKQAENVLAKYGEKE